MLTDDNFVTFAMRHYDNPSCKSSHDFDEDLNRFKYLKKLLNKYLNGKKVSIQLILNHVIIIYNVFDSNACTAMLFHKMEKEHWSFLKTLLNHLNMMPDFIAELGLVTTNIPIMEELKKELEEL